jgi:hypothetical protein
MSSTRSLARRPARILAAPCAPGRNSPVSFLPDQEILRSLLLEVIEHLIARLLSENANIQVGGGIGGHNTNNFAAVHANQGLFQAQQWQRTMQPARIHFMIKLDHPTVSLFSITT